MTDKEVQYLIKKGGYFYREKWCGYTQFKFDAGRYTKAEAEAEASVEPWHMSAIHENEVPDERESDKFIAELRATISAQAARIAELEERLCFDPGGSDKIDELESACEHLRVDLSSTEARVSELEKHVEELQAKINPETDCCCSYDEPGQVCAVHSPRVSELERQLAELSKEAAEVLAPIKHEADQWEGYGDLEVIVEDWPGGPLSSINVGHLRAARTFLDKLEGGKL